MPAIFSTIGRAALALGKRIFTKAASSAATTATSTVAEAASSATRLAKIKNMRKGKLLHMFENMISPHPKDPEREKQSFEERVGDDIQHMRINFTSVSVVVGIILLMIYSFFTNVMSNAPMPSGAL